MESNFQNKRDTCLFDVEVNRYAENIRRLARVVNTAISLGSLVPQHLLLKGLSTVCFTSVRLWDQILQYAHFAFVLSYFPFS